MKVGYDLQADALYITLNEQAEVASTIQVDPGTLVDLDSRGNLIGVEVIRPARPWPLEEILSQFPTSDADAHLLCLLEPLPGVLGRSPTLSRSSSSAPRRFTSSRLSAIADRAFAGSLRVEAVASGVAHRRRSWRAPAAAAPTIG
jgi:uncharacterized protein YuzE